MFDFARGAKTTGSKFYFNTGTSALTEFALLNYMIQMHAANGYEFVIPPYLVNKQTAAFAGLLPRFEGDYYETTDGMMLVPTAETPLVGMHANEIFKEEELPKKYVAFSPCFRKEAGAAGSRDKGLKRVHQFHKVELFAICTPEQSEALHNAMIDDVGRILGDIREMFTSTYAPGVRLKLIPNALRSFEIRKVELTAEDRAPWSNKTIDFEIATQGTEDWMEVSSVSNTGENQSKLAQIRYKPKAGGGNVKCHLLNGSGVALPRLMIALGLE